MGARRKVVKEVPIQGPNHETYAAYGLQCSYCALKVTDIRDPKVAFWAYRQFSIDHVVPRNRFPTPSMLEYGLRRIIGGARASGAALAVEAFNLVPACHNCNNLLNAYPNSEPQSKILEGFLRFFPVASLSEPDAPSSASLVVLEEVKRALVGVWQDKCIAMDQRLDDEKRYYEAHYVPLGLQRPQQREHAEIAGFRKEFLETMEKRWLEIVKRYIQARS